jgi:hypothetical protein
MLTLDIPPEVSNPGTEGNPKSRLAAMESLLVESE